VCPSGLSVESSGVDQVQYITQTLGGTVTQVGGTGDGNALTTASDFVGTVSSATGVNVTIPGYVFASSVVASNVSGTSEPGNFPYVTLGGPTDITFTTAGSGGPDGTDGDGSLVMNHSGNYVTLSFGSSITEGECTGQSLFIFTDTTGGGGATIQLLSGGTSVASVSTTLPGGNVGTAQGGVAFTISGVTFDAVKISRTSGSVEIDAVAVLQTPPAVCGNGQLDPGEDCDDGNTANGDCCSSTCTFEPVSSPCDDGLFCTVNDVCNGAGQCGGSARDCSGAGGQCSIGVCDEGSGSCLSQAANEGGSCSDDNACTQTDSCQSGVCTGSNPVTCNASDQCHDAGTCNTQTGLCSDPPKADGATCSDGNACTQTDSCQSGVCTGSNPVTCNASDQCHDAGTCNTQTGLCSDPLKADGATCSDGDLCTTGETCQSGSCVGGTATTCNASDQCHDAGTCDPSTGTCSDPPKASGTPCDDASVCTQGDQCDGAGACVGSTSVVCTPQDQCHDATCDPQSGGCVDSLKVDGSSCDDGDACTAADTCQAGACVGTDPVCISEAQLCTGNPVKCLRGFACYKSRNTRDTAKFTPVSGINLLDQFGSTTMDAKRPIRFCNPVDRDNSDPDALTDPDHLILYRARHTRGTPSFDRHAYENQRVVNLFGVTFLDVRRPDALMVPSAASLTSFPDPPASPQVDHFQCYRIARVRGTGTSSTLPTEDVGLLDSFGSANVDILKALGWNVRPARICVPVDQDGGQPGAESHLPFLTCYILRRHRGSAPFVAVTPLFTNDVFSPQMLDAIRPRELCVPSLLNP